VPKLTPWILVEASDERCVTERNPYYWKVDTAGNQLPYIDRIDFTYVPDGEVMTVQQMAGESDYGCEVVGMPKLALYRENEEAGNYNLKLGNIHRTSGVLFLNLTNANEQWRKVMWNVDVRRALSHAIDRVELIDTVYYGLGDPTHMNPSEYDPDLANELLDGAGMDQRDADGFRLDPDGNPFVIDIEISTMYFDNAPASQLYMQYFKDVGINTTVKTIDYQLLTTRLNANELYGTILHESSTTWYYKWWGFGWWDILWNQWWNTQGAEGEEPPQEYKDMRAVVDQTMVVEPTVGRWELKPQIDQMVYDYVWYLVPSVNQKQPRIENKDFGNCSDNELCYSIAQTLSMEQVFYKSI